MKEMLKPRIMNKDSVEYNVNELYLMKKIDKSDSCSKFVVNVHYAFQTFDCLYLVIDLLEGGDLRFHLMKEEIFQPNITKFFIACIALGLEACHK